MTTLTGAYNTLPYEMSKREKNLLDLWKAKTKKSRVEINLISDSDEEQSTNIDADHAGGETVPMSGEKIHAASSCDSDKSCDKLGNEESHQAVTTVLMEENSSHCSPPAAAAYENLRKIFRISEWVTPVSYKITPSFKQSAITSACSG